MIALALLLAAAPLCQDAADAPTRPGCAAPGQTGEDWRRVASDADRARLRNWRASWMEALAAGAPAGNAELFDPDRALPDALPPLGAYRCRIHRLGRPAASPPVTIGCRIEGDKGRARFVVEEGAQRPVGHFYPDGAARAVFLGTVLIGDEARSLRYGRDRLRDVAGLVERIGAARWRIALPRPRFGGQLDLIELVPASGSGPSAAG